MFLFGNIISCLEKVTYSKNTMNVLIYGFWCIKKTSTRVTFFAKNKSTLLESNNKNNYLVSSICLWGRKYYTIKHLFKNIENDLSDKNKRNMK